MTFSRRERDRFIAAFVLFGFAIGILVLLAGYHAYRAAMEPYHGHSVVARRPLAEAFLWLTGAVALLVLLIGTYAWYDTGSRFKGLVVSLTLGGLAASGLIYVFRVELS